METLEIDVILSLAFLDTFILQQFTYVPKTKNSFKIFSKWQSFNIFNVTNHENHYL